MLITFVKLSKKKKNSDHTKITMEKYIFSFKKMIFWIGDIITVQILRHKQVTSANSSLILSSVKPQLYLFLRVEIIIYFSITISPPLYKSLKQFLFIFNWRIISLKYCVDSAVQHHESVINTYIFSPSGASLQHHPYPAPLGYHRAPGWAPCVIE